MKSDNQRTTKLSNHRHLITVTLLSVSLILSGCVTPALWQAAEGEPVAQHGIKILSVTSAFKAYDGNTVHVCMLVVDSLTKTERKMALGIPVQDRRKWKIQRNLGDKENGATNAQAQAAANNINPTYIEYSPTTSALTPGCKTEGTPLPVLRSTMSDSQKNPQTNSKNTSPDSDIKMPEAIYVINRDGVPANIGYLSDKPLFENGYAIDVPLDQIADQAGSGAKHYLYLLTPVTVVMDAAITVLYVAAWGYTGTHYQYQYQQPTLTIKATSTSR
ncbi:MAG: hypothetical protein ACXU8A_00955 [Burkholderiaceae bacterium]